MRGNRAVVLRDLGNLRSIPAYAGEPTDMDASRRWGAVYPRVCGGTRGDRPQRVSALGLSPRMRGNRAVSLPYSRLARSIPAYAGEPLPESPYGKCLWVYPRVCGGTSPGHRPSEPNAGLSPRMRGNRRGCAARADALWSIPAYAGEPHRNSGRPIVAEVYPRVCGGTPSSGRGIAAIRGLSPRMRGKPLAEADDAVVDGSIPAYAGEPDRPMAAPSGHKVYPRVCGGTSAKNDPWASGVGLSPRMRGNPAEDNAGGSSSRSIPAYAGEPNQLNAQRHSARVYPRVCGGTAIWPTPDVWDGGLSPRMRGNPLTGLAAGLRVRSIPAYAGEPSTIFDPAPVHSVYPRVCGGTLCSITTAPSLSGLSPRMRGNHRYINSQPHRQGSIPAYAGEPYEDDPDSLAPGVYPRVCGGTSLFPALALASEGLSPRMRGNPCPSC